MDFETTALLEYPEIADRAPSPSPIAPERPSTLFDRLLVPITILLVLVCALPIISTVPGRDQGTYLEIGSSLLSGKHLYSQLLDNKPPGIFLVYAGIVAVFGRVIWSVAFVEILLLLAISYLLFKFVEGYLGRTGAAIAVVVHAAWNSGMTYYWIVQPETLQGLCALATYLLIASRAKAWKTRCVTAGAVCGFAFWLKYNFVVFFPLFLVVPFLDLKSLDEQPPRISFRISWRDWLGRATAVAAGFTIVIVAMMAWIVGTGAWPMMREAQFEVLPRYAHMGMMAYRNYWLAALVRSYFYVGPSSVSVLLIALVIGWRSRDLKRLVPLFLASIVAIGSVVMQVRLHSYYFQICYPFFAPLWGYVAIRLFDGTKAVASSLKGHNHKLAAGLVWVVFGNLMFLPMPGQLGDLFLHYVGLQQWHSNRYAFYANYPDQIPIELLKGQFDVVNYIKRTTNPGDSIYLWGSNSLIYFLADRQPPTRFVLNLPVIAKWGQPSWKQEIARDVRTARPRLIIVTRHDMISSITYVPLDSEQYLKTSFPELRDYLSENYRHAADFKDFAIYERKDSAL